MCDLFLNFSTKKYVISETFELSATTLSRTQVEQGKTCSLCRQIQFDFLTGPILFVNRTLLGVLRDPAVTLRSFSATCLAMPLRRDTELPELLSALLFATDCSNGQHHCTVRHPSSNFSHNFTAVLIRAHAYTSRFSFRGALGTRFFPGPRSRCSVTPNLGNLQCYISKHCEKIAQCNRAYNLEKIKVNHSGTVPQFIKINKYFETFWR